MDPKSTEMTVAFKANLYSNLGKPFMPQQGSLGHPT